MIKGVTMRAIFSNPAGWKFIDSNGWKKKKFEEKKFFAKIASGQALFSKGQKSTSKLLKTPETKKMSNKTFKCSKLLLFLKKIRLTWWKT